MAESQVEHGLQIAFVGCLGKPFGSFLIVGLDTLARQKPVGEGYLGLDVASGGIFAQTGDVDRILGTGGQGQDHEGQCGDYSSFSHSDMWLWQVSYPPCQFPKSYTLRV